ncbi:hypothetical protein [Luteimonas changyuni]|uniref:hypothetical protein n=1 Tax=Luteimonas sp. MJ145 TaxID=3129234 RepID=UPI0031BB3DDC
MRLVGRNRGTVLALFLIALCAPVFAAAEGTSFPAPMLGVWEPELPCDPGEASDRDGRFEITGRQRLNYEEIEDLVSADLLTSSPRTWRILTTSNIGPEGLEQPFIYVLEGDLLTVADGRSARMYMRCK